MITKRPGKKWLKVTGIIFGILIVSLTIFHFWFVAHAKDMLEGLVESESNGKLKLKVGKFRFNWFSKKMELENAVFYSVDADSATTSYRFSVNKIRVRMQSIFPILFKKEFLIDSLNLYDPDIQVTLLKAAVNNSTVTDKEFSIPAEMGKVYTSIQDALEVLQVSRFQIDNAKFSLINKIQPGNSPLVISHIDIHIDNLQVDSSKMKGNEKMLFGDNILLRSHNQDISFPDGRHRLGFSHFNINIRKKIVEFDSCTISSSKKDSSSASFKVFFDKLVMSNIDFDTLYRHNVIKADSVYCVNPQFRLEVVVKEKKGIKKDPPRLDQIIKQITGDVQLGFVMVNNASFDINTVRNEKLSSFTSDHNNFEMKGFAIDKDAERPLKIKSFAMAIRNYENFLRDSSYAMQFDSILFKDNKISLSNFSFQQLDYYGNTVNSFDIPDFQLVGLSWDELLFERKLKAEEAFLFNPVINYTDPSSNRKQQRRQNLFQSLAGINRFISLENLNIVDGEVNVKFNPAVELHLKKASLSIKSRSLLHSQKIKQLQQSVNVLNFKEGTIKVNNVTALLGNVRFNGNNQKLTAENVQLTDEEKNIQGNAKEVTLDEIFINDSTGNISVSGIKWKQADLKLNIPAASADNSKKAYSISIDNINTSNTKLNILTGGASVTGFLQSLTIDQYIAAPGSKPQIINLVANGNNLQVADKSSLIKAASFRFMDKSRSEFQQISYNSHGNNNLIAINIPTLSLTTDLNKIINGNSILNDVSLNKPIININLAQRDTTNILSAVKFPSLYINRINISQPVISFIQPGKKGATSVEWNGLAATTNQISAGYIKTNDSSLTIATMDLSLNHFLYKNKKGKNFNAGNGKIIAGLKNISLRQNDNKPSGWNADVNHMEATNFILDSLGKKAGRLQINSVALKDMKISSANIKNIRQLAAANSDFLVSHFNGNYSDSSHYLQWFNAGFYRHNRTFTVDSFTYYPTLPPDSFMAKQPFQVDYIKVKTGALQMGSVDVDTYIKDGILNIGALSADNIMLTDYRDKRLPFEPDIIKPLPVTALKKIPFPLSVDTIFIHNGNVAYTEINDKTNDPGTVTVNRMAVKIFPVRNYNLSNTDSLNIQASGYLMDTAWIRLRIRESYTDSLAGFLMTLRIRPIDLQVLNPVLIPMSSVKIQQGYIDTISLRAVGKEYLAFGEMKMLYHDLKIKFLKNGSETKKTFLNGLKTFIVNSFFVRNKNTSRTGMVFFIRDRERSSFNYLIKIAVSGMASSVGAKNNRKLIRKYLKELRIRKLPPIDYD